MNFAKCLSSDDPTELYQYSWKSYGQLQKRCNRYLEELCVPGGIDDMQICQCDLTCNLVLDSQEYVDVYLRILKNPTGTPKYRVDIFKCNEKKPKNPQQANQHSHCIRCKQASFPSYDKIDQLKMIGRCPDELEDAAILWLEAQLSRPALKRALGSQVLWHNSAFLKEASDEAITVINGYQNMMFPCDGIHLRYEDAVSAVLKIKKKAQQERMLYLLKKVSDTATLDSAAQKVKDHYTDVERKRKREPVKTPLPLGRQLSGAAEQPKATVYLLDQSMGLDRVGLFSDTVCMMAVEVACAVSYRTAATTLNDLTGLNLSHESVWRIVQNAGSWEQARVDTLVVAAKAERGAGIYETPVLYEEMDGVYLALQGKDRLEYGLGKEMKVSITYSGIYEDADGRLMGPLRSVYSDGAADRSGCQQAGQECLYPTASAVC